MTKSTVNGRWCGLPGQRRRTLGCCQGLEQWATRQGFYVALKANSMYGSIRAYWHHLLYPGTNRLRYFQGCLPRWVDSTFIVRIKTNEGLTHEICFVRVWCVMRENARAFQPRPRPNEQELPKSPFGDSELSMAQKGHLVPGLLLSVHREYCFAC